MRIKLKIKANYQNIVLVASYECNTFGHKYNEAMRSEEKTK